MRSILRLGLVIILLCLCGCFRTTTEGTQNKKINTVTQTTEIREEVHGEKIVKLKTETFQKAISTEEARYRSESTTSYQAPPLGGILGGLATGGILGGGPLLDIGSAILTIFGGKKAYDKVRDATPRQPTVTVPAEVVRKDEDDT